MKSLKLCWLVLPLIFISSSTCLLAQNVPGDEKSTEIENGRANVSGGIKIPQDDPVKTKRTIFIQGLIKTVLDDKILKTDRVRVHKAMLRLGRMKALEAVPAIVERLDVHVNRSGRVKEKEPVPTDVHYPAIKALKQIGSGAMPHIVDSLVIKKRSKLFRENATTALAEIAGSEKKYKQYLRDRIALYRKGAKLTFSFPLE